MLRFEAETFYDDYLRGLFPQWKPTSYEQASWIKDLGDVDFEVAKNALAIWRKEKFKTETEPVWRNFVKYVRQCCAKEAPQGEEYTGFFIQCISHRSVCKIGQYVRFQVKSGANLEESANSAAMDAMELYGGIWVSAIEKDLSELRADFTVCKTYFAANKIEMSKVFDDEISLECCTANGNAAASEKLERGAMMVGVACSDTAGGEFEDYLSF